MHNKQDKLAKAVRTARKEQGLSQAKLAENLSMDSRTILNIEAGRGNPKFKKLCQIMDYLNIPCSFVFGSDTAEQSPSVEKIMTLLSNCTEQEASNLLPMISYMLELLRKKQ